MVARTANELGRRDQIEKDPRDCSNAARIAAIYTRARKAVGFPNRPGGKITHSEGRVVASVWATCASPELRAPLK
jgi:hypothetical protein